MPLTKSAQIGRVTFDGAPRVGRACLRMWSKVKVGVGRDWGLRIWSGRVGWVATVTMVLGFPVFLKEKSVLSEMKRLCFSTLEVDNPEKAELKLSFEWLPRFCDRCREQCSFPRDLGLTHNKQCKLARPTRKISNHHRIKAEASHHIHHQITS